MRDMEADLALVLTAIAEGRTMEPLPCPTGLVLCEAYRLELIAEPWRAVPTLTEAGHEFVRRARH